MGSSSLGRLPSCRQSDAQRPNHPRLIPGAIVPPGVGRTGGGGGWELVPGQSERAGEVRVRGEGEGTTTRFEKELPQKRLARGSPCADLVEQRRNEPQPRRQEGVAEGGGGAWSGIFLELACDSRMHSSRKPAGRRWRWRRRTW
jgi:hypothetical protein